MKQVGWRDHGGIGVRRGAGPVGAGIALWARLALMLVLGAALTAGCGSAPSDAAGPGAGSTDSREAQQRTATMVEVFGILEQVGMKTWADYGRTFLVNGQIIAVDFSSPEKNQWGATGLDAAVDPVKRIIYVDKTVWLEMPPRHLAIVMLDELAHLYYHTGDHDAFDAMHAEFIQLWEASFGRPFNSLGPEDSAYQEWWDAFLLRNP